MTQQDLLVQALGSAQLMIITQKVEIENLKEKLFKLEKTAMEAAKNVHT